MEHGPFIDDIPYMKWKIKFMFQTTNQFMSVGTLKTENRKSIFVLRLRPSQLIQLRGFGGFQVAVGRCAH